MKYNLKPLLFLLLACLSLCQSAVAKGKSKKCKPIHANRHKKFVVGTSGIVSISWDGNDGKYSFEMLFRKDADSGLVYKGGSLVASYPLRNFHVAAPWAAYEMDGQQLVDTIDSRRGNHYGSYYGAFGSPNVVATTNLTENSVRYYARAGGDSLIVVRHRSGAAARILRYNDRAAWDTLEFNTEGILTRKAVKAHIYSYYPSGVLQQHRLDTVLSQHMLSCVRYYYDDGVIKSVEYYNEDTPAHVWLYYNGQGELVQTVKKRQLSTFKLRLPYVEAATPERIFKYVEQSAEFPGGFEKYMVERLVDVLCQSRRPLSGTYRVQYSVDKDGTALLIGVQGENAEAITPALNAIFASMPHWRPAKRNGVPSKQVRMMPISLKRAD